VFLPKGTPADIVHKLQHALAAAENLPAVQQQLRDIGADPIAPERSTPEYLAGYVAREIAKWAAPIKASGVSVD
jgi:tripartite-type tricarboxylate transporter receptor subunit TctC